MTGGGQAPYVRIWDLASERCAAVLPLAGGGGGGGAFDPAPFGSPPGGGGGGGGGMNVTSLCAAWPGTDILVAGTAGGAIQVLDMRVGSAGRASPVVASLREHRSWVVGVCQARAASVYSLVSGSVTADVRFWDLRRPASVHMIAAHRTPMTALALHDFAPLLATGARRQQARVFTNSGEAVADIRYREAAPGAPQQQAARIGPVSAVAFHPHRLYLGVGSLDGSLSVHAGAPAMSEADA